MGPMAIARTIGIWVFGLAAGACFGGMVGTGITYGYENQSVTGAFGGMFAFSCLRLWLSQRRAG